MPSALKCVRNVGMGLLVVFTLVGVTPQAVFGQGISHVVKPGETLTAIAQTYGTSVSAIASANGLLRPDLIWEGQNLAIPGQAPESNAGAAATESNRVYVVQRGDTLGSIARAFGVSASALAEANGITDPDRIYVGQTLVIPGGSSSAPSASGRPSRFVVDISKQHCWLYRGDTVIGSWACSTGRSASPTKTGTFRVQSKLRRAYGSRWNIIMPYWLGIYWAGSSENGIHGMPWNATSGRQTWPGLVGTRITYGCIMLSDSAAKKLWDMAYIGMPVIVQR